MHDERPSIVSSNMQQTMTETASKACRLADIMVQGPCMKKAYRRLSKYRLALRSIETRPVTMPFHWSIIA